jgi:thioredoxin reductase (NADPH)
MEFSFSVEAPKSTDVKDSYDVVIIGGGPTGLTAAIYSARASLSTLVVEKGVTGGLVTTTELIENYPGFPEGVSGSELGRSMEEQAKRFGAEVFRGEPQVVDLTSSPKLLKIGAKDVKARAVIVATGTTHKKIGVRGERELAGRGVSYCATCDGPFFKDKELVVVGAGNSGVQESVFLAKYASKITIVEFLPTIQAERILVDRFLATGIGSFITNHEVVSIEGSENVEGVRIRERGSAEEKTIPCSGVFIWVGLIPQTESFKNTLELDQWGFVKTDEHLETNVEGVWAAGDVVSGATRQIAAAVGSGATAAIEVEHYLTSR